METVLRIVGLHQYDDFCADTVFTDFFALEEYVKSECERIGWTYLGLDGEELAQVGTKTEDGEEAWRLIEELDIYSKK